MSAVIFVYTFFGPLMGVNWRLFSPLNPQKMAENCQKMENPTHAPAKQATALMPRA